VLDTPTQDGAPQDGIVSVRNFQIVGEPNLDRLISSTPQDLGDRSTQGQRNQPTGGAVQFIRMRVDFTRTPGRFAIREGLIFGPAIGATVDGVLDYANNAVQLRGTYVPAYGLNNFFGQLPVVGLFLGGPKEGLLALTFEIAGPASRPILRVNPMSMAAPGFFRKIFEFRGMQDAPPTTPLQ
nr:AsmA-like C-terminal region-containing protein [Xanthobacteraceae bacterium]